MYIQKTIVELASIFVAEFRALDTKQMIFLQSMRQFNKNQNLHSSTSERVMSSKPTVLLTSSK
jgi:hypothetical protein